MDTTKMTRNELYAALKARDPVAATGKTRAPRHELLQLLAAAPVAEKQELPPGFELVPTREELYEDLKVKAPKLALGQSRARREELLALHAAVAVSATTSEKSVPKPKKRKPKTKLVAAPGLSAEDGMVLRRVIYSMEDAGKLLNGVSIGISGVAALLAISTGLPAETVQQVLEGLLTAPKDFGAA